MSERASVDPYAPSEPPADTSQPPAETSQPPAETSEPPAEIPEAASDTARPGPLTRTRRDLRQLPRQFWLLAFGFFVLLLGIDMCYPFESTYLHERLGYSMTTVGLLIGLPLLLALPLFVLDGVMTDRFGRKSAIVVGGCVITGLYTTFALAGVMWQLAIAISLEAAFGWALFLTASNAMVADLVPLKRRAEAYSITRVALHLGMVLGPLIGAVLIARDPTYRSIFLAGAGICASFVVIVLVTFRETRPAEAKADVSIGRTLLDYGQVLRDRRFLAFCLIALLPGFGFGQLWSMLPVLLQEAQGMQPHNWGFVIATYALSIAVFQYPVIRLLRGRDHILLLAAASLFIGVGFGWVVLVPWGPLTFAGMFVLAQGALLLIPLSSTVSAEMAPVTLRGRYMGTWTIAQEAGFALGPTFGGMAMDHLGARTEAMLVTLCGLMGAALYAALARRIKSAARMRKRASGQLQPGAHVPDLGADRGAAEAATVSENEEAIGDTLAGETPIA